MFVNQMRGKKKIRMARAGVGGGEAMCEESILFLHFSFGYLGEHRSPTHFFSCVCIHTCMLRLCRTSLHLLEFGLGEEHVFLHHGVVLGWERTTRREGRNEGAMMRGMVYKPIACLRALKIK